jgi:adenylate kinase
LQAATTSTFVPALILFGSPGSGKGTQAKLLKSTFGIPHVSTGDMLRSHIALGDEIGKRGQDLIRAGKLVPDELVNQLVEQRLEDADGKNGIILDGYPRTINQAKVLLNLLAGSHFKAAVVHLVVDYEKIVARLSGRRQCPVCGTLYSLTTNPPKVAGICDLDGTALVTREDDKESVIRERLQEYDRQTVPILNFFKDAGVSIFEIQAGAASPDDIMREIRQNLAGLEILSLPNVDPTGAMIDPTVEGSGLR